MLKEKNDSILFLPFEEISIWLKLSSPPNFRIQGGSPERDKQSTNAGRGVRKSLCLIYNYQESHQWCYYNYNVNDNL